MFEWMPQVIAAAETGGLETKTIIVIVCNAIFFGIIASIAYVAKIFPEWDRKQKERNRARMESYKKDREEKEGDATGST